MDTWITLTTANDVTVESLTVASEWGTAIVRRYRTRNQVHNTTSYVGVVTNGNHVSDMHFGQLSDAKAFCRAPYRPLHSGDYWHGSEISGKPRARCAKSGVSPNA